MNPCTFRPFHYPIILVSLRARALLQYWTPDVALIHISFPLTHILFPPSIHSCTLPLIHISMFQKLTRWPHPYFNAKKLKSKIHSRKTKKNYRTFGFSTFQDYDVASCADIIATSNTGCLLDAYLVSTYPYSPFNANRSAGHSSIFQYDKIKKGKSVSGFFIILLQTPMYVYCTRLALFFICSYHRSAPRPFRSQFPHTMRRMRMHKSSCDHRGPTKGVLLVLNSLSLLIVS